MSDVHHLTVEPDGLTNTWRGRCSCGKWQSGARNAEAVREAWRRHVTGRR